MTLEQRTVAFLGLGGMGRPMASRILDAGHTLSVWNRSPDAARPFAGRGARVAADPADAVRSAEIVITMVTDAEAVLSIADHQGMLAAMAPGATWAQMSTIGISGIERVAALVADRRSDVTLLDAPVAGSRGPAERGQLTVFAAGPDQVAPRVSPVFDALGHRTVWVGPVGAGSRVKLVNNTFLAFVAEGIAESIGLGRSIGLDLETMLAAMDGSPLVSTWAAAKLRRIGADDYSPEYPLALAVKDVNLALETVDVDRFAPANGLAAEWQRAMGQGLGGEDVTVLARALQR
ncbi:NAD(P)-dependent oxidoreductase [Plantactinospora sp. GCM10030261]|uniref:NAD(P)-dependent oxidoreductase n=1 Tax=Plantactinospora sp. GCM10030261 TaxID=3273420 RepID=UPI003611A440